MQRITETLPVVTITHTSEISITETPTPVISVETLTLDPVTVIETSVEVLKIK